MRAVDIIARKRDGEELSAEEIDFFVQGLVSGAIPDYQVAAWAMAVLWRGMTAAETAALTMAMVRSGEVMDLARLGPVVVDKHSTGGVGDKTTLVVAPLVSAAGLPVAKMSGRGLGFSGGTLDKLEAIPGFNVSLSTGAFLAIAREVGVVVAGQTGDLVPADGKLYALRDVTATVPSLPLIASSIMSKKIAGGADAIVLDVKVGKGAFMRTLDEARALAKAMIAIGQQVGRRVTAVLSDMNQPLGQAVGNGLEVAEAIAALRGEGPEDLIAHCLTVAAEMLVLGERADDAATARRQLEALVADGRALERFRRWVQAQGGDPRVAEDVGLLPAAPVVRAVEAPRSGYIAEIDAEEVGLASVMLGAGRERKGEPIDPSVGVVLGPKVGQRVQAGDHLFTVHARSDREASEAAKRLLVAYTWSEEPVAAPPLVYDIIRGE
ncbi:MAG TPA: thymidine phosphorylase [Chloroflexi bacterium]|jgi:pyrimidine-nucleoside phosphorylase|nr:thymidine phosphorylase [Chloroflexota bacterium]